ncbi:penicillin acylase family protein [candidate division KSB1 bacterium]
MTFSAKSSIRLIILIAFSLLLFSSVFSQTGSENITVPGLTNTVEILKDKWGISHIYAGNQADLFFAQGFNVARDRLFQLELWRREATGTLSEVFGEKAFLRDHRARLFKYRGDMKQELNHYHPDGEEIINSFVSGINAFVDLTERDPDLLSVEFRLLGIKPKYWTPEVVISRHNGLYRNVANEVGLAAGVDALGIEEFMQLSSFEPSDIDLKIADGINLPDIPSDVLEIYASRRRNFIGPEDIVDQSARIGDNGSFYSSIGRFDLYKPYDIEEIGSNNWVVSGDRTASQYPIMANDPHRTQQVPSLRYWAHLTAPGWNVIGGGEPSLPGLSIGHNEHGAWGLTIFSVDQEDLYVYDINPSDENQYRYRGNWESMTVISERIDIKNEMPRTVDLKFTRHGPVVYEDKEKNKAYAVNAAWLEKGCAPYLASLRMDQAENWDEFREACTYSRTPSENMVWADRKGNIGWQAVGITPIRKNWYGLLPVPGDGTYEWEGYLPIRDLPWKFNPSEGFIATANEFNVPHGYPHRLGYQWSDKFRSNRIAEVLGSGQKFSMTDMMNLQCDELSVPARDLIPMLSGLESDNKKVQTALDMLLDWDFVMDAGSVEPSVYLVWEQNLRSAVRDVINQGVSALNAPNIPMTVIIGHLTAPDGRFGEDPLNERDNILITSLQKAVGDLEGRLGKDMKKWQYGQEKMHYVKIRHILSRVVNEDYQDKLDVGPLPRGGYSYAVNNTSYGGNQRAGASFRIIADTGNWDNSVGANTPGQSGDPDSPFYKNLFDTWAKNKFFPVFFSRDRVESVTAVKIILKPGNNEN